MVKILSYSIEWRVAWFIGENLAKLGISYINKKINDWENKQLQSGLNIIEEPKGIVAEIDNKEARLSITIHLWSSIPTTLHINEITGIVKSTGFETNLQWSKKTKDIYQHYVVEDIKQNKNSWIFSIKIPLQTLKDNAPLIWQMKFVATFQHCVSKTFQDIKFKIRDSDIKRIREA